MADCGAGFQPARLRCRLEACTTKLLTLRNTLLNILEIPTLSRCAFARRTADVFEFVETKPARSVQRSAKALRRLCEIRTPRHSQTHSESARLLHRRSV